MMDVAAIGTMTATSILQRHYQHTLLYQLGSYAVVLVLDRCMWL